LFFRSVIVAHAVTMAPIRPPSPPSRFASALISSLELEPSAIGVSPRDWNSLILAHRASNRRPGYREFVQAEPFDIEVVPGQRVDLVLYWQLRGSGALLSLDDWTPSMVIEQDGNVLFSNLGPEPDFQLTKSVEVGRMDLFMGFEFTSGLFLPYDSLPQLRYYIELVDDTLNTNTVPLLRGALLIRPRD
jgi:hypothetical protein